MQPQARFGIKVIGNPSAPHVHLLAEHRIVMLSNSSPTAQRGDDELVVVGLGVVVELLEGIGANGLDVVLLVVVGIGVVVELLAVVDGHTADVS